MIKDVSSLEELKATIASKEKVVVMFWVTWGGPCKMIMPFYEKHAQNYGSESFVFLRVDVDALPDLSSRFGISAMPTFKIYKNGYKDAEIVGARTSDLERAIALL